MVKVIVLYAQMATDGLFFRSVPFKLTSVILHFVNTSETEKATCNKKETQSTE